MSRHTGFNSSVMLLLCCLLGSTAFASESLWRDTDPNSIASRGDRWVVPQQARTVELDIAGLRELLQQTPMESQQPTRASSSVISLPMPDGQFARFAVVESPVMEAGLALKFPQIRTYSGQGLDDASASLRLDVTPKGLHAQVLSANGESYIDPYQSADDAHYVVYSRRGFGESSKRYQCGTDGADPLVPVAQQKLSGGLLVPNNPAGSSLRTYRLALVSTASYTNAFGGTVADGIAGLTRMTPPAGQR